MRSGIIAAVLSVLLTTAACGDDPVTSDEQVPDTLAVAYDERDLPGAPSEITPTEARCGRASYDRSARVVTVRDTSPGEEFLTLEVAPVDEPTTYEIPPDGAGRKELRSRVRLVWDTELTTASLAQGLRRGDGRTGSVRVVEASCDPAVLRIEITARLGSTYTRPLAVTGGVDAREAD